MPSRREIYEKIVRSAGAPPVSEGFASPVVGDYVRRLHAKTNRNVIAYYSNFLAMPGTVTGLSIDDMDMNGFMANIHKLDRKLGLDLILHTPGGEIAATEAIVKYLWKMFDKDIRVIVPQLALSAGTMIACAAKSIIMGKQSSLGPIDPQIGGVPAEGVLDEFEMAVASIQANPVSILLWQQIISRYHPSFINECAQAIDWSRKMVAVWLKENMLYRNENKDKIAETIVSYFSDHNQTSTHSRHIAMDVCQEKGLNIIKLEEDQELQDIVLSIHHAILIYFQLSKNTCKLIRNHSGEIFTINIQPEHENLSSQTNIVQTESGY
ncbi:MAG: ATP-dependent Clp protease proteolytic subunit [Candidatus Symbiobacter sp.]|nr:ATP-dependent Clp protease proteolytic subunit [Candidatus Symbiobacter sp.]